MIGSLFAGVGMTARPWEAVILNDMEPEGAAWGFGATAREAALDAMGQREDDPDDYADHAVCYRDAVWSEWDPEQLLSYKERVVIPLAELQP